MYHSTVAAVWFGYKMRTYELVTSVATSNHRRDNDMIRAQVGSRSAYRNPSYEGRGFGRHGISQGYRIRKIRHAINFSRFRN